MSLPCIRFVSFTLSYLTFIILITASSLQFAANEKYTKSRLSQSFPDQFQNYYVNYSQRTDLAIKFPTNDFYIRHSTPLRLDIAICIFILGFLVSDVKKAFTYGLRDFLYSWSDMFTLI